MTNESDALIEQLRQHDAGISRSGVSVTIFSEAADRIAALEAELAQARERYEREKQMSVDYEQLAHESGAALRAATARIESLTAERKPTGWIITHKDGRVIHFSKHDGWTLDIVSTEP